MRHGFDPWIGKIPWKRKWQPTPVFLPGESHRQRSYSPWGLKKSHTTEQTQFSQNYFQSCYYHGEGNGTPLQYSCLENPMDGGAWWAAVHGVAKSWTWLSDFTFTFHFHALEKEMAPHSGTLAWKISGMEEPGGRPSMGSHRVGHDWSDLAAAAACYYHDFLPWNFLSRQSWPPTSSCFSSSCSSPLSF